MAAIKSIFAVVDIAPSHPTHQSPSEGLRIRPKLKMHYAGTMADSNAYILKIDGTTTRSVCSIGVACSSALLRQSGTENRHAVPLGLPTFIAEALCGCCRAVLLWSSVALLWGSSRTPAVVFTKLWPCNILLATYVLPLVQTQDGGDQSNVVSTR